MNPALQTALGQRLGTTIVSIRSIAGGDINQAYAVATSDHRRLFVKTSPTAPLGMYAREADGIRWLAKATSLALPEIVAVADSDSEPLRFLVLGLIDPAPKHRDFDERLGRGLAQLHRFGAPGFGGPLDNFIATLPQENEATKNWSDFYRIRRLEPQLRIAGDLGRATSAMRKGFAGLLGRLHEVVGPEEPASRLHGDLWGGNCMSDQNGSPCLIDPAAYGGHREMDLAMMRLFGGFSERVFSAYREAFPLAPGWQQRVELYQLYPLMVHVNLFGGSYSAQVQRILDRWR